jgi:CheY-like chemotaxis protein
MKVLIAEDDAPSRLMLQALLAKWGCEVVCAVDGADAWRVLCQPEHPQLMILDWMMPGVDGLEIVRRLGQRQPEKLYYPSSSPPEATRILRQGRWTREPTISSASHSTMTNCGRGYQWDFA